MTAQNRIDVALDYLSYGQVDGDHHKLWAIDQAVRALTGCPMLERTVDGPHGNVYTFEYQGESDEYLHWVEQYEGHNGEYEWDTGVAP